jgi:predicted enzyme related to lactoylglutathione lyase
MALDLFAGLPVTDYAAARPWYERLLGGEPTFMPHATEAVWSVAEHRAVFVVEDGVRAGRALVTIMVDDLDAVVEQIASRGLQADERVTYSNGVRKATYRDTDGNEISYGDVPA